jgi:hypothetical protein
MSVVFRLSAETSGQIPRFNSPPRKNISQFPAIIFHVPIALPWDGNSNFDAQTAKGGEKVVTSQIFAKIRVKLHSCRKSAPIRDTNRQTAKTIGSKKPG